MRGAVWRRDDDLDDASHVEHERRAPLGSNLRAVLVAAFSVALGLRLLHLRAIVPLELGTPAEVGMDRWLAMHVASAVADGRWLGGWAAAYDTSPVYSYIIAGLYRLGDGHWLVPLLVQAVLGACTPLLLYDVGTRLFSRPTALLAACLAALYTPVIFYEGLLVWHAPVPVTVAAALSALVRARTLGGGWSIAGGAGLGLLVLLRPNAALVVPAVLAWLAWGPRLPRRVLGGAIAGLVLAVGPMVAREAIAARQGMASSLWGIHFYIGANPDADGGYVSVAGVREDVVGHIVDARAIAERERGRSLPPWAVSAYWFRRGLAFIAAEPRRYAIIEVQKLARTFAADETGTFGEDYHVQRAESWVLALPLVTFATIGPLGLLGLVFCIRRRKGMLVVLYVITFTVALLAFFVEGRHRLALVPALVLLAAEAVTVIATAARDRAFLLPLSALGLIAAAAALGARPSELAVAVAVLFAGTAMAAQSPT